MPQNTYKFFTSVEQTAPKPALDVYSAAGDNIMVHDMAEPQGLDHNVSAWAKIQTAWAILMANHSGASDVVFEVAMATSHLASMADAEELIAAMKPVQVAVEGDMTVADLVQQINSRAVDALGPAHMALQTTQPDARADQLDTLVVAHPAQHDKADSKISGGKVSQAYSLMLACRRKPGALQLSFNFDRKVVRSRAAKRMLQQLEHVVQQLCTAGIETKQIAAVEVLCKQDLRDIWNWNKSAPPPVQQCVHHLVADVVHRQPHAPAVCAWDGDLTYAELDDQSTRLARYLVTLGVGPNVIVPLCFEKSKWHPVAMMAVMKAGAASVAMDTTLPDERLRTIAAQVKGPVIVASVANRARAAELDDEIQVVVPEMVLQLPATDMVAELPAISPSDRLYIVFTSGSTGTPKGAMITHSNFSSASVYQQEALGFSNSSRVYDFASYAFDISWSNNLRTLTNGGCICIPSQADRQNDITGSFRRLRANTTDLTPSVARLIDPADIPGLRHLIFCGEPVMAQDVKQWKGLPKLLNVYGPAECTVHALVYNCEGAPPGNPSIGWGAGHVPWVVDKETGTTLISVGGIGELWLEGPSVGAGYLADPKKTAAAFVEDPEWLLRGGPGHPGRRGRLYKTGDLVRYSPDGSLTYMGRKDAQVKIRGQRVELGDIEHHIKRSLVGSSKDCQVVAEVVKPDGHSNPMLVAFISSSADTGAGKDRADANLTNTSDDFDIAKLTAGLDESLKEKLPSYMIPTVYIPIAQIPMTATGKTDRKQLREKGGAMALEQLELMAEPKALSRKPTIQMEYWLRDLWAQVLGIDSDLIGLDDSFLRIGGDSISAMRLVSLCREQGLELTVATVFEYPQLCQLSRVVCPSAFGLDDEIAPFSLLKDNAGGDEVRPQVAELLGVEASQIEDVFPCTPLQEGLLAETAKRPGNYVSRIVLELHEVIDIDRFRAAWEQVVAATAILRTRVVALPSQGLVQAVVAQKIQWLDTQSADEFSADAEAETVGFGTSLSRFGVHCEPASGKRVFTWILHHAVYDGWSMPLVLDEVEAAYKQEKSEGLPDFQPFVKHVMGLEQEALETYWQSQLQGCEATVFPALPSKTHQPQTDKTLVHQISALEWPKTDITASTAVRTALSVFLSRYTAVNDVVFGATVTGRQAAVTGVERMAGPTIATVPVRVRVEDETLVGDLLQGVQTQTMRMTQFEQTGLQRIRNINREIDQASQFQTLLVIQPADRDESEKGTIFKIEGKTGDEIDGADKFSAYALELICQMQGEDGLQLRFSFDSAVVDSAQASRMAQQLEHILRQLCAPENEQKPVAAVEWTSAEDLSQAWKWNASLPATMEQCVHDLVAEVVRQQPDAPAVCAWDGELTYAELDWQSTRIARRLVSLGVGPEVLVPLCFDKSKWVPVAVMGVMKAGGASVLIDTALPDERIRSIMDRARGPVVLASVANAERATRLGDAAIVIPELLMMEDPATDITAELPQVSPSNKLYVVFTSGSTGTPKGAIITHSNFSSAIYHQRECHSITSSARVYDFASYAFDVSWLNLLHFLAAGACLCIPSQEERQNDVAGSIRRYRANWAQLTPSVARLIDPAEVPDLQRLVFSGEPLLAQDVTHWRPLLPRLLNTYGPAECTVTTTVGEVDGDAPGNPSIGWGSAACVWVVDSRTGTSLTSIGGIGELWLEGPLVGQGYLADPEKTAAAFVEDPAWLLRGDPDQHGRGHPGRRGRLYKTGDLVRYSPDGSLAYIGRKDAQVKIRGQRVELGDVAHHVQSNLVDDANCPVVAEIITPEGSNAPILAAFVDLGSYVSDDESENIWAGEESEHSTKQLESILRSLTVGLDEKLSERVPSYMIPTAYIPVTHIPMTATGKTDRRQLRNIGSSMSLKQLTTLVATQVKSREPSTEMELRLQQLWATVLNIDADSIGAEDSFLKLGGESIAAMRLISAAREQGLSFTVADVFKHSQLCALARVVTEATAKAEAVAPFSLLRNAADEHQVRAHAAELCGFEAAQIEDVFPCTPLQEGLLALSARRPGDYIYRAILEVQDNVDLARLRTAIEEVVATTPILRTRIIDLPGQGMVQVVARGQSTEWRADNNMDTIIEQDKNDHMNLGTSLVRFGLGQLGDKPHLMWAIHHALYDGWSWPLLMNQIEQAYAKEDVRTLLAPFQPFVKHVLDLDNEQVKDYWQSQLGGCEGAVFPALPSKSYQPRSDLTIERRIAGLQWPKTGGTAASTIRAAWSVLASRYTDVRDVVFGATVTGRQAPVSGIEQMAGPTIATVPVRVHVGQDQTVTELLQQVQTQATDMIEYEQTGIQRVRHLSSELDQASQFQTLLVVQPADQDDDHSTLFNISDDDIDTINTFNVYALMLVCELEPTGLRLTLNFDSAVFDADRAAKVAQQLEHILRQFCAPENEQKLLSAVDWTSPQDLRDIWSRNALPLASIDRCVHHLIDDIVQEQPNAPAVCAWDGDLTYGELDKLSTQLAHHLAALGVGPEVTVPLCFEKSKWMPVAILGVMKAGGACVAMDTTVPNERLQTIINQVRGPVILSSAANAEKASTLDHGCTVVVPERFVQEPSKYATTSELPEVHPTNKLYVVFTSGSTGTPKGVVITHSNFSSAIKHQQEALGFSNTSRVYDFVSYAFDIAWSNNLRSLAAGGCICIPSQEDRQNGIASSINRLRANWVVLTPSIARSLNPAEVPGLEHLIFGGEALLAEDVAQWKSVPRLVNGYGPAECSVMSTMCIVDKDQTENPSIGKGTGLHAWIVDRDSGASLVSTGCTGELWLEGPLVGQGYLSNPEKTAAAFVEDPQWLLRGGPGHPGRRGRLYKTGDLVQQSTDGSLMFIGRKDAQVKIRGQRVELGDIEYHVRRNLITDIDCQVVADVIRPQGTINPVLAAFVNLNTSEEQTEEEHAAAVAKLLKGLEERLAERLPGYMIPTVYIPIQQVPMTTTGKTDRSRLLKIGSSATLKQLGALTATQTEMREPTLEMELRLRELWASVLSIDASGIGADDSFLQIGGDSISAMRLVGLCREQGLELAVADIFENPRLCSLAAVTKETGAVEEETITPFSLLDAADPHQVRAQAAELCNSAAERIEDMFPCTPLQEGLLALTAKRSGAYINRTVFELKEGIDLERFYTAVESVVATTPILRTRIVDLPGHGLIQVVATEPAQWLVEDNIEAVVKQDEGESMGLGTSLVRFGLGRSASKCHFMWTMHHALYDGWSLPLLLDQIEKAYQQKPRAALAPFQPFVKHIMTLEDDAVQQFWRSQLKDCEAAIFPALPSKDYQPRTNKTVSHHFSELTWPTTDITAASAVRAAWSILAASHTDSSDVIFGAAVTGRQAPIANVEQIAGPTIATVPVRVRVNPNQCVKDLLHQVQTQAATMTQFEQTGLQRIRRIGQDLEQASQFQTLLAIQPSDDDTPEDNVLFSDNKGSGNDSDAANAFNTYALMLTCQLKANGLKLAFDFDSSLMDAKQAKRMAQQMEHVLRQLCMPENESKHIADIKTLSEQDLHDIWKWNASTTTPIEKCIHNSISETVLRQPNVTAVCAWDGEYTYAELEELSTRLAHHLLTLGVGPGVIVPLCFEKSKWTPVAMLGVMKTGAASVAMDSTLPSQRLRTIVSQVLGPVILSSKANSALAGRLAPGATVVVAENEVRESSKTTADLPVVDPSNKMCIVFTSGSTGTPKGAILTHTNFSTAVENQLGPCFGISSTSRVYDFASYAFDLVWSNAMTTFVRGGCICIPSQADRQNSLAESFTRMRANWALLTPSVTRAFNPSDVPTIEHLCLGGEQVLPADIAQWKSIPHLIHAYGPTECTVISTLHHISKDHIGEPTLGYSIGLNAWIVDKETGTSLTAIGSIGELALEGPSVAAGYLRNPEKTAAAFVEDPAWLLRGAPGQPGRRGRLYRTGDLVRYNSDGSLMFVGRKDAQVKIRGQRVELDEIAHHVLTHMKNSEGCKVAVEMIKPEERQSAMLAAFISTEDHPGTPTLDELTAGLQERLSERIPVYMVPAVYIPIPKMPLTTTDKTDRKKLREMGAAMTIDQLKALTASRGERRMPSTAMELKLQKLWATVLRSDAGSITADDDFFQLGGDSIAAMRLTRIAQEQGLSLTVAHLFDAKRLCDLASSLEETEDVYSNPEPFSLVSTGADLDEYLQKDIYPYLQDRDAKVLDVLPVASYQKLCLDAGTSVALREAYHFFLDLPRGTDVDRLANSCLMLHDQLDVLRTVFIYSQREYLQVVLGDVKPTIDIVDVEGDMATACQALYDEDLRSLAPLGSSYLRFLITRTEDASVRLTIRMSHAQYDGISLGPLMSALTAYYNYQEAPVVPSFAGYVRHALQNKEQGRHYWKTQLEGSQLTQLAPISGTGSPADSLVHMRKTVTAPKLQGNATSAATFTALYASAIAKVTGSSDVVLGLIVSGRATLPPALQGVIGPCLNTLPIRARLENTGRTTDAVASVQDQLAKGMQFETSFFHDIVEHCTKWPKSTREFGFMAEFLDVQEILDVQASEVLGTFEGYDRAEARLEAAHTPVVRMSAKPVQGSWELELKGSTRHHDSRVLQQLLDELAALTESLN